MLTKLTKKNGNIVDDSEMKEVMGRGPFSCMAYLMRIAEECNTVGTEGMALELYDCQKISSGGWF
jgi:hypothetical protein